MKLKHSREPEDQLIYENIRRVRRAVGDLQDAIHKVSRSQNPALQRKVLSGMLTVVEKFLHSTETFESVMDPIELDKAEKEAKEKARKEKEAKAGGSKKDPRKLDRG